MPKRIGLRLSEWPAADRREWDAATAPASRFDARGVASRWRPKSRQQACFAYGRWLAFLKRAFPRVLSTHDPSARVTHMRVEVYVAELANRITEMSVAAELQHLVLALGAIAPSSDWTWLRKVQYRHAKAARSRDKRPLLVDARRLLKLGLDLMDTATDQPHPSRSARQYRDGLLIAILASRPMRRKNLAALTLGSSVLTVASGYRIEVSATEAKSGELIEYDVPDWLTPYMKTYVEEIRPRFAGARRTQALWLSSKGGALLDDAIYATVCRRTHEAFGFAIRPHLFRDIAATTIAREAPDKLEVAQNLLAHVRPDTTQQHYAHSRTIDASRQYTALIEQARQLGVVSDRESST